jgi:hypothetical protein
MRMNSNVLRSLVVAAGLAFGASGALAGAGEPERPKCKQDHPGRTDRAMALAKNGDSKSLKKVAKHTVKYALKRYAIEDLVSETDIERAEKQLYRLLDWKLGSVSAAAAQWVSAGYQHFDKAYVDEAAGLLLGVLEFDNKEPDLKVPTWLQDYLKGKVSESGEAISMYMQNQWGVPKPVADVIGNKVEAELMKATERNIVGYNIPKKFDIDNRLVEGAIEARRARAASPSTTTPQPRRDPARGITPVKPIMPGEVSPARK